MSHALIRVLLPSLGSLTIAAAQEPARPATPAIPAIKVAGPTTQPPVYGFEVTRMDGTKTKLDAYKGKVLLLVNTASQCGLTPQYEGLQKLQQTYGDKGFTVLAFPANNFGQQEPGSNEEIAAFCKDKYAVSFPVFAKISVKGDDQAPLYKWLTTASPFPGEVTWNFQKYLVDREGQVVARFDPRVKPQDSKVIEAIDGALGKTAVANTKATKASTAKAMVGSLTAGADAIAAACKQAKADDKVAFVHFSADWCGWCKKLEAFMERPEIKPIFTANFVDVRVATDKMADGEALLKEYAQGKSTGIPFMVWMTGDSTIVARSFDAKGDNIGYPSKPEEIAAFMQTFTKLAKHATPEQVALVRTTLESLGSK